jgi:SPP1 gp7 family putative phage head morphogenesis protein
MQQLSLLDALTRHQIRLQRLGTRNVQAILPMIRRMARKLHNRILTGELTADQLQRTYLVMLDLDRIIAEELGQIETRLAADFRELAQYEADHTLAILKPVATVQMTGVAPAMLESVMTTKPMQLIMGDKVESVTLKSMYRTFGAAVSKDVRQAIQAGVIEGKATPSIAREIRQMVNNRSRRQAEAVVRTAVNHVASVARQTVMNRNADIFEGERFVATLDGRTSPPCQANDSKVFPVGQGPIPPLHYNCRSVRVGLVKQEFRVPGFSYERASMDGPVDGRTTYQSWLKRQDKDFIVEVLGVERAELFISGRLSLDRFVDSQGVTLTLAELKRIENIA